MAASAQSLSSFASFAKQETNFKRKVFGGKRKFRCQLPFLGIPRHIRHIGGPMQLVRDIYAAKAAARQPVISFEFFPPKTDEGDRNLLEKTLPALLQTRPDYCSGTYGAGG